MPSSNADRLILGSQRTALVALPTLLIAVFVLHFRHVSDFFNFQSSYSPRPPAQVVAALVAAGNKAPLVHDPHVIAYLALPLFLLCASGLYTLGRRARPLASLLAMSVSVVGVVYLGGLFGMWSAFYRGLGDVDPHYLAGATATFAAMSAPKGAFLLTTTLAKLAFVGMTLQALALFGTRLVPRWSPLVVTVGCGLFLAFWDIDNWMLVGAMLMLAGFLPVRSGLSGQRPANGAKVAAAPAVYLSP
jgi:hypothetical protein